MFQKLTLISAFALIMIFMNDATACNLNTFVRDAAMYEDSSNDTFYAYKATSEPHINGLADEDYWSNATWYPLNYVWLPYNDNVSPDDFSGRFKISWTNDRLLLLAEVTDDSLFDGYAAPLQNYWDDDCVEVFLDEDCSGGNHLYSFNAFAYHVSTLFDVVDNSTTGPALFNNDIEAARTKLGNTYTWELAIKVFNDTYIYGGNNIPVTLTADKKMGFSLAYCDDDGSGSRENFIGSKYLPQNESNNSYIDASIFGKLFLKNTPDTPDLLSETSADNKDLFHFYPNPAKGILYYTLNNPEDREYYMIIRDITGKVIINKKADGDTETGSIDLTDIPDGFYVIEVKSSNLVFFGQIILL